MNPAEQEPQITIYAGIGGANAKGSRAKLHEVGPFAVLSFITFHHSADLLDSMIPLNDPSRVAIFDNFNTFNLLNFDTFDFRSIFS